MFGRWSLGNCCHGPPVAPSNPLSLWEAYIFMCISLYNVYLNLYYIILYQNIPLTLTLYWAATRAGAHPPMYKMPYETPLSQLNIKVTVINTRATFMAGSSSSFHTLRSAKSANSAGEGSAACFVFKSFSWQSSLCPSWQNKTKTTGAIPACFFLLLLKIL